MLVSLFKGEVGGDVDLLGVVVVIELGGAEDVTLEVVGHVLAGAKVDEYGLTNGEAMLFQLHRLGE
ncbi:hypothetical protein D3C80_2170420 [compost metagenome]